MDLCEIDFNGNQYAFRSNSMTGERYWYNRQTQIIAHLNLSNELKLHAINKCGIPAKTFAPPPKRKPVSGGSGQPRIKTKIRIFDFPDDGDDS